MPLPDSAGLSIFIAATIALLVLPGPAVLFIVARGVQQGRAAAIVSMLGIHVGTLVHVAAAALGVSAILASSAVAFTAVKYLGAAYLVYLGLRTLLNKAAPTTEAAMPGHRRHWRLFRDGAIVNLLNPKTALFFLAFLPQFVDPARGGVALQIMLLGLIFVGLGIVSDGLYALFAGAIGNRLKGRPRFVGAQRWVIGAVYIGLGALTAVAERK